MKKPRAPRPKTFWRHPFFRLRNPLTRALFVLFVVLAVVALGSRLMRPGHLVQPTAQHQSR